jgi:hypothetical protein
MIRVVNIKTYRGADCVYIGRAMPGRQGSPLANRNKLRYEAERADVLARYIAWLRKELESDTEARREIERLADLAKGGDLVLACWCAPKLCHGDVVKQAIEAKIIADREGLIRDVLKNDDGDTRGIIFANDPDY